MTGFRPLSDYLTEGRPEVPANYFASTDDLALLSEIGLDGFKVTLVPGAARRPPDFDGPWSSKSDAIPPLGPLQLVAFLGRHGGVASVRDAFTGDALTMKQRALLHDPRLVCAQLEGAEDPRLGEAIRVWTDFLLEPEADLLGLSALDPVDPLTFVLIRRELRARGIETPVVVGGIWETPDLRPEWIEEIDYWVNGEGEVPLLLLCDALRAGQVPGWFPGRATLATDGSMEKVEVTHSMDLLDPPDLGAVDLARYQGLVHTGWEGAIAYRFVVGCPMNCAYCNGSDKAAFKARRPEKVVSDLVAMHDDHGARRFLFLNSAFNVYPAYADELLDRMIEADRDWEWCDCCRPTPGCERLFPRMRAAGATWLNWGFDASSRRLAELYRPRLPHDEIDHILQASSEAGLRNVVNVIVGLPHETEADIEEWFEFYEKNESHIDAVFAFEFKVAPNSQIALTPERFGLKLDADGGADEIGGRSAQERAEWARGVYDRVLKRAKPVNPEVGMGPIDAFRRWLGF